MGVKILDKPEIKIQNIVASADLGRVLNLRRSGIGLGLRILNMNPSNSPACLQDVQPKVVMYCSALANR